MAVRESLKHLVSDIGATLEGRKKIHYKCRTSGAQFDIVMESEPVSGEICMIRIGEEHYAMRIDRKSTV